MQVVCGVHPVREVLESGRPVDRVLIAKGAGGTRIQEIVDLCRQNKVPVRFEAREALDRASAKASHQGVVAYAAAREYAGVEDVEAAKMLVVLDGLEDPHNLGAVLRSANAAGADAVIIPERRSVGLTDVVAKAAAGALEHVPVVRVTNIAQTLIHLKEKGFWVYGLDERGEDTYDKVEFSEPAVLVLGGEGKGLHQHVKERCDFLVRIPMAGKIPSLNVSVAAGIMLFEWKRRRASSRA